MKYINLIVLFLTLNSCLYESIHYYTPRYFPQPNDSTLVTIMRDYCYGKCPAYDAYLLNNGTVHFNGLEHTQFVGDTTFRLDSMMLQSVINSFYEFNYFDLKKAYITDSVTEIDTNGIAADFITVTADKASKRTSFYHQGKFHSVLNSSFAPAILDSFEFEIEKNLNIFSLVWNTDKINWLSKYKFSQSIPSILVDRFDLFRMEDFRFRKDWPSFISNNHPNLVKTDFNKDGFTDYAVLLDFRDKFQLLAAVYRDDNYDMHILKEFIHKADLSDILNRVSFAIDMIKQGTRPGIRLIFFEGKSYDYFFEEGRFQLNPPDSKP